MPILGTSVESIDRAEDRERFEALARGLGIEQPPNGTAVTADEAVAIAERIGYPVLLRPSYVLGGRGDGDRLRRAGAARLLRSARWRCRTTARC